MKQINKILNHISYLMILLIIIFLSFLMFDILVNEGIIKDFKYNKQSTRVYDNYYCVEESIYINPNSHIGAYDINSLKRSINLVPELHKAFKDDNGIILISGDYITDSNYILGIENIEIIDTSGYFTRSKSNNYIILKTNNNIYYNFLHEIGHYLDRSNNKVSNSKAFKDIYKKYQTMQIYYPEKSVSYEYSISNRAEYFTTIFVDYILNPEELEEITPDVYAFIDNIYKEVIVNEP